MDSSSSGGSSGANEKRFRPLELVFCAAFVILNIAVPMTYGEIYPFSTSPMFSDQPEHYCTYEVFSISGDRLDEQDYGLHLVYDGNPVGLGVGIGSDRYDA